MEKSEKYGELTVDVGASESTKLAANAYKVKSLACRRLARGCLFVAGMIVDVRCHVDRTYLTYFDAAMRGSYNPFLHYSTA